MFNVFLGHGFTSLGRMTRTLSDASMKAWKSAGEPRRRGPEKNSLTPRSSTTHATVYPVHLAAVLLGFGQQGRDLVLRGGVVSPLPRSLPWTGFGCGAAARTPDQQPRRRRRR